MEASSAPKPGGFVRFPGTKSACFPAPRGWPAWQRVGTEVASTTEKLAHRLRDLRPANFGHPAMELISGWVRLSVGRSPSGRARCGAHRSTTGEAPS